MIWLTAKLTDVSRRQTARPSRASGSGWADRAVAAQVTTGLAMRTLLDGRGSCWRGLRSRFGPAPRSSRGSQAALEVGDEIGRILEPD
jgi:hypothetical protein